MMLNKGTLQYHCTQLTLLCPSEFIFEKSKYSSFYLLIFFSLNNLNAQVIVPYMLTRFSGIVQSTTGNMRSGQ